MVPQMGIYTAHSEPAKKSANKLVISNIYVALNMGAEVRHESCKFDVIRREEGSWKSDQTVSVTVSKHLIEKLPEEKRSPLRELLQSLLEPALKMQVQRDSLERLEQKYVLALEARFQRSRFQTASPKSLNVRAEDRAPLESESSLHHRGHVRTPRFFAWRSNFISRAQKVFFSRGMTSIQQAARIRKRLLELFGLHDLYSGNSVRSAGRTRRHSAGSARAGCRQAALSWPAPAFRIPS